MHHFSGWCPPVAVIDALKSEGSWNNDWDASLELLRRHQKGHDQALELPKREQLIEVFSRFYFGGDPTGLCWFDLPLLRRSESLGLTLS